MNELEKGLNGSICRGCKNWIFYDWYICNESMNCDKEGFIILPVKECREFEVDINKIEWNDGTENMEVP